MLCYKNYRKGVSKTQKKTMNRKLLLNFLGVVMIIFGFVLLALTLLMQNQQFNLRYAEFLDMLARFDDAVTHLPFQWLIVIAIILIYMAKALVPIPTSAIIVIAGMVFPTYEAVIINIIGFFGLIAVKYAWGRHLGSGIIYKLLCRYENVQRVLQSDTSAKDVLLVGFRLVPVVPINTVSQIYGAMDFDFIRFTFLSLLGFMPRIISYAMVGRHVFNPFSFAFMLPLVIMFELSGVALIGVNAFVEFYNSKIKSA